jgi:hypothetical protein
MKSVTYLLDEYIAEFVSKRVLSLTQIAPLFRADYTHH